MELQEVLAKITEMAIEYVPQVLLAILALLIGFWIIGKIVKALNRTLERSGMEVSLSKFLSSLASVAMKVMLLLSVAGMFGVNTTSFVAILGALMVGIGMALNGSIGHLASGVMIMLFKPFKVGDLVEIGGGHTGSVEAINAFNTTLATLDNKRIIIANSNVTGNTITNISGQGTVGVNLTYVLDDPTQGVVVAELGDSSVNLATRPFCKSENYWDVFFYMQEHVKKAFDAHGIGIPYPQMDIHMISDN